MTGSKYLYAPQDSIIAWAEFQMAQAFPDFQRFRSDAQGIAHIRNGNMVAAVVFDTFSEGDCMVHLVSDGSRRWMTREFALRALSYPFHQLKLRRVSALVSEHNAESLAFMDKFGGWKKEGVLREAGYVGEDMILFGMLKRECVWLRPNVPINRRGIREDHAV